MTDRDRRRALLASVPLFSTLNDDELGQLLAVASVKRVLPKEEVIHRGDEGSQVFAVLAGRLKVLTTSLDGDDVAFSILGPGDIFGELAALSGGRRSATITALDACEMLVIHRRDFLPFLRKHPDVAIKLLEVLARRLRRADELFEDTMFLNLPTRLAKKLLELSDAYGQVEEKGIRVNLKLSQEELGDLVAASRESVNRQLRIWIGKGLLSMNRGFVTLLQPGELENIAEGEPAETD